MSRFRACDGAQLLMRSSGKKEALARACVVHLTPLMDKEGNCEAFVAVCVDPWSRRAGADELHAALGEERLRSCFPSALLQSVLVQHPNSLIVHLRCLLRQKGQHSCSWREREATHLISVSPRRRSLPTPPPTRPTPSSPSPAQSSSPSSPDRRPCSPCRPSSPS